MVLLNDLAMPLRTCEPQGFFVDRNSRWGVDEFELALEDRGAALGRQDSHLEHALGGVSAVYWRKRSISRSPDRFR
jgi:hypothetical protein